MMPNKFLRNPLKPGEPISRAQVAEAIDKMDKAWGALDCLGGDVDWHNGRPTIIPPGSSGELIGGGGLSRLYRVRYFDGKIQIYGVGGDDMYRINGVRIAHETVASTGNVYDWW